MERFLQNCDSKEDAPDGEDVNWHIVNPTTSAQYFHLLRRQMLRNFRKPLVVVAPKILLRLSAASSDLSEMASGTHFKPVIGDDKCTNPNAVTRLIFVSGKHYYAVAKHVEENKIEDTAIVRLEQLCPFPTKELQDEVSRYKNVKKFVWSQEEHQNSGAWTFVEPRFANLVGVRDLGYAGRVPLCQPAVGVGRVHQREVAHVMQETFKKLK
jgi:probable 2-oxoglutarate dehydrogenase E1 component DHKTD1